MRPVFEQKLGLARTVFPYVENHNFYIEHWSLGVFWRKMRELNRLFMAAGFWSDPEGLFFLSRNEVRDALWDYCCAWAVGSIRPGPIFGRSGSRSAERSWTPCRSTGRSRRSMSRPRS